MYKCAAKRRHWLKTIRWKNRLTSKEMAKRLGLTVSYYSMIENGHRQPEMASSLMDKIKEEFGISLDDIREMEKRR